MDGSRPERRLPVVDTGHTSAAEVLDDWYVACRSNELRDRPLSRALFGLPIVLFRGANGTPGALLDRCPHRNVPLSDGRVVGERLQCGYHGWEFDTTGQCQHVPALCGTHDARGRRAPSFAALERDGVVWVYATPDAEPEREPYAFEYVGKPGYRTIVQEFEVDGTVHAVAENALDVPHTAFLHSGLFRGTGARNQIEVRVRRWHDRVEAEYIGEPAPRGLVGRILAPGGGVVTHFDRFVLPCVAEVEYRLGDRSHVMVCSALTPISAKRTRLTAVTCFKLPVPGFLVGALLKPIAKRIFAQDARILKAQLETIEAFGGESFMSTDVDALGPGILRLLRNAERGDRRPLEEPVEKSFTMEV